MTGRASPSAFHITIEPSGRSFSVAADETILAAGIAQGINLPYGCKDGACGSCKCKKISGSVQHGEHQSKALSDAEAAQGFVLTCCARPMSDVVLESRQVTLAGAFAIKKMPARIKLLEKKSHDVMPAAANAGPRGLCLPRRPVHRVFAAGRRAPQLFHGQRTAAD